MKRKLLIIVIFLMMCSTAFSKPQKLKLELIRSPNKIFDCPQLNPNFEFASMFYQAVCFNRNLLNLVDNEILKATCKCIYEDISNGYACLMTVKRFSGNQDLEIKFEYFNDRNALLILSNYDAQNKKIITNKNDMGNAWGLLYYIIDGTLVYYEDINKPKISAEEKLKANLTALKENPVPILYISITENYFEMGMIDEGIKFLNENKDKAIELNQQISKIGNIKDVILCVEEEGKVLKELNQ